MQVEREVSGIGKYQAAELAVGQSAFRADCARLPDGANTLGGSRDEIVRNIIKENARRSGLDAVEIEFKKQNGLQIGIGRGSKEIHGIPAMYHLAVAIEGDRIFSAMIGAPASEFPSSDQTQFLSSVGLR